MIGYWIANLVLDAAILSFVAVMVYRFVKDHLRHRRYMNTLDEIMEIKDPIQRMHKLAEFGSPKP